MYIQDLAPHCLSLLMYSKCTGYTMAPELVACLALKTQHILKRVQETELTSHTTWNYMPWGGALFPALAPLSNEICFNALMKRDTATVSGGGGPAIINPLARLAGACTWPCAPASPPSGRPSRSSARIYTRCTPAVCHPAASPRCFRTPHMTRLHTPHGDQGWRPRGSFHYRASQGPGTPTPAPHQGGHVILPLFPAQ
jgi:hypothetical protein